MLPFSRIGVGHRFIADQSPCCFVCIVLLLDNRCYITEANTPSRSFKDIYCSSFWCADQIDIQSVAVSIFLNEVD